MDKKNSSSGGLGLPGVLTVVFVVLKLVGLIDWSWWWVLSPLWIEAIILIVVIIGFIVYYKLSERESYSYKRSKKGKWRF